MPLTKTGAKVKAAMTKEYGAKKGEQVFYATMNKYGKKWHHSPDEYVPDDAHSVAPKRLHYKGEPANMHPSETPQKAGGSRGNIQQADGTANMRAGYRTRAASVPEPGSGKNSIPSAVDTYNDSEESP